MIEQIIILSLFCCGVFLTGEEGMIFYRVKEWIRRLATYTDHEIRVQEIGGTVEYINHPIPAERSWFKPVWGCVICMASVWGTIGFVIWNLLILDLPVTWNLAGLWVITILAVAFTNGLLWNIYGLLGNLHSYWDKKEDKTK